jgi:4-amino-4-deoxy-L-arabinose transferase-like glycosyltransferase|tara:strand:+ start:2842 stop:4170 length:1329 start_codon:yes stop_codon:yes gene_type:complete
MEFSEARYAEISRIIYAGGDWITLWYYQDQPFWGKPPLAFWSVATSFHLFGLNELAARLPSLLFTVVTAMMIGWWCRRLFDAKTGRYAILVFCSSWLVLHTSGAVITDPLLTSCTTLVMIAFWQSVCMGQKQWGYLLWFALGLGLLAKGPLALVLCGIACGLWVVFHRRWRDLFAGLNWITGPVIMAVVAFPWYWLAEQSTPGFLEYFLVGEHWQRYTQSEWQGDLYGSVKDRWPGTIWLYFLLATLPWSPFIAYGFAKRDTRAALLDANSGPDPQFTSYLLIWMLFPLVFFTPASNVLVTYVMPGLPAFAILLARKLPLLLADERRTLQVASVATLFFAAASVTIFFVSYKEHRYNQKPIMMAYREHNQTHPGGIVYTGKPRFSALFYSEGKVIFTRRPGDHRKSGEPVYIAYRDIWYPTLTQCDKKHHSNGFSLWYCPGS